MRHLTRLFLFIAARVGLSFAIALWLISDIWGVTGTGRVLKYSFRLVNCREGLAVSGVEALTESWNYEWLTPYQLDEASWVFDPSEQDQRTFEFTRPFPGVGCLNGSGRAIVSIRHWLLITIAIAFYLLLKLVYRNRPEH